MKKFVVAAVTALSLVASHATAAETFFSTKVGQWTVFGNHKDGQKNPVCLAETTWKDGSKFQLIKDLTDGELYVWFQNLQWNIGDEVGKTYRMKMTAYSRNDAVSGDFEFLLVNKNTIVIPALQKGDFAEVFMVANKMMFYMPGTISNAELPLWDSKNAAATIARCIESYKPASMKPKGTPI